MERPLISVIVSAYNVDKYIERCVRSIMDQTYDNLQIICVNDCSNDKTLDVLQNLASIDQRICVLTLSENRGLSEARNAGINVATVEFGSFVDGDDEIRPDTYARLVPLFKENVDVVWCGVDVVYEDHEELRKDDENYFSVKQEGLITIEIKDLLKYNCVAWNKIFRRSQLVPDLRFSGRYYEDALFFMKFFACPRNVYFVKDRLYVYYRRPGSIMSDTFNKEKEGRSIQHMYILDELREYWLRKQILSGNESIFYRIFEAYFSFAYQHCLPYEKAKVVHEATQRLRSWNSGEYEIPLLEVLRSGNYDITFFPGKPNTQNPNTQNPKLRKIRGIQKLFCIRNEQGHKVVRLFTIKIASRKLKR